MQQDVTFALTVALIVAEVAMVLRAMLRPLREPTSRIAWVITILVLPVVGIVAYLLLGEARISAKRRDRFAAVDRLLPRPDGDPEAAHLVGAGAHAAPFARGRAVNGLPPTLFNSATLFADSNTAIDAMIADIDAAETTVHLCFYIWLADTNGIKMRDALIRASRRGIAVRVLTDALGSRSFHRSDHWQRLRAAGVDARIALPVGGLVWTLIRGRLDLRNHRKTLVVDNRIGWCGSQNIADPEFRIKARFGPWIDVMTRWEGPVARHLQFLFAGDWMAEDGDDITALLAPRSHAAPPGAPGIAAQVIGTGPNVTHPAMTECFAELVHAARRELTITTPYFVPDDQLLYALLSAARRGVRVALIVPRRNDSWIVAGASRSTYADLLHAGVELYEFRPGLLHAKTMVADGVTALIGSANLDRRSFELNFENNVLFADAVLAGEVGALQERWIAQSDRVTLQRVRSFGVLERLWQNLMAMFGPVL
ncbi:cardiolipin synthase [Novosphingobium kunmingense]|uniref:Cardiolipin synthase n=1 Tax=Novosphingobium kunmingense TaxID=1211806 RepID=A0A2N0I0Z4_9SPHN|nr:cardiolipin synthase [Novosphingobium kunmingense]PKB24863.1 cardiolipin synthase [Novosphingobium kunmingense]